MAVAMATLTNRGVWHDPYFVQRVETNSGEVLYEHPVDEGERRVSQQVADNVIQAMKPIAGWSNGALAGGRESAAKTGTHQLGDTGLNKDTWMIGSTPQLASAVWRSEEHTSELQSRGHLVCRLLLEKKNNMKGDEEGRQ